MGVHGYTRNECPGTCQDRGSEHAHLRTPDGDDVVVWADGRYSGYDLTQPARLLYPAGRARAPRRAAVPASCYRAPTGFVVHVRPECRCPRLRPDNLSR